VCESNDTHQHESASGNQRIITCTNALGLAAVAAPRLAPPKGDADARRRDVNGKVPADPLDDAVDGGALGGEVLGGERHHRVGAGVGLERPVRQLLRLLHGRFQLASQFVIDRHVALGPEQRRGDDDLILMKRPVIRRVKGATELNLEGRKRRRRRGGRHSDSDMLLSRRRVTRCSQ
jgi:hypothetical protein